MIAVVGESVLDRTTWPNGHVDERLGGSPIYAARSVREVRDVVILTRGADEMRRPLEWEGVSVVAGPSARTTVFAVSLHGDGMWSESIVALGCGFAPRDVDGWMAPALKRCSTVVCGTQWRGDFSAETISALADGGRRRIYLDGQGMARPARLGPIRLEGPFDALAAAEVDVLKLSESEAVALFGGVSPAAVRAARVAVVVITMAERGAVVFADGNITEVKSDPVLGLTDTVGAGDGFIALMAAEQDEGATPVEAARVACDRISRLFRSRLTVERLTTAASSRVAQR